MEVVSSLDELRHNLITVERYINGDNPSTKDAMFHLISFGRNFVAYKVGSEWHFAPSRFVGYRNNTLRKHDGNDSKDGRVTSQRLRRVSMLGLDTPNKVMNGLLEKACASAGHGLKRYPHTFWVLDSDIEKEVDESILESEFEEGKELERLHKMHERDTRMIRSAKTAYISKYGSVCQICGFDYVSKYGDVGVGFIEAHHTVPVSELKAGQKTKLRDIAFICANCHRMLHRSSTCLPVSELSKILKD